MTDQGSTRRSLLSILLVAMQAAPALSADFNRETWCEGRMAFSNEDGTAELYDLMIWYDAGQYALVSHDLATGEVIEDRGSCDLTGDDICKHYIEEDDASLNDAYAFMLIPLENDRYLYKEIWLDGSQGRGMVACFSAE